MATKPQDNPVIREILRQGKGKPKRLVAAALETGRIESNFTNLAGGDADSVNWRQERASIYGGDMSIRRSVARFYKEAAQLDQGQPSYELAADVQRPAAQYRGRYKDAHGEALQLLGSSGGGYSAPSPASPAQASAAGATTTTPGVDNSGLRRQLVGQFLQQGGVANPNAVLTLAGSYGQAADVPASAVPAASSYAQPQPQAQTPTLKKSASGLIPLGGSKNAGNGSFEISGPNPGRLKKDLVSFADQVAAVIGAPIVGLDGSSHSKYTVNGNVSQHYSGDATDIFTIGGKPATGARLLRAGRAALIAAGMPRAQALKAQGGLYNVNGHQIIFSAKGDAVGGDHTDHLHISD